MATLLHSNGDDSQRNASSPRPKGRGKKSISTLSQEFDIGMTSVSNTMTDLAPGNRERQGYIMQERHHIRPLPVRGQRWIHIMYKQLKHMED